jgi:hypothetical protein
VGVWVFINSKRDQNSEGKYFQFIGKDKVNKMGKKCLFIPNGRVVRRGKIKCTSQVKCEGDIKRLLDANFHYINEFDF